MGGNWRSTADMGPVHILVDSVCPGVLRGPEGLLLPCLTGQRGLRLDVEGGGPCPRTAPSCPLRVRKDIHIMAHEPPSKEPRAPLLPVFMAVLTFMRLLVELIRLVR